MEVAAPSCPPGRLPACECLAPSHQGALSGEVVYLLSLPLCPPWIPLPFLHVCGLGNLLFPQFESAGLRAGALKSAWPRFKSHIMLLTDWDFSSLSLTVLVWKMGPVTPTKQNSQLPEVTCKAPDGGSYNSITKSLGTNSSGFAVVGTPSAPSFISRFRWGHRRPVIQLYSAILLLCDCGLVISPL